MNAPEQRAAARRWIGSSNVAGILGVSKWRTPLDEWRVITGKAPPIPADQMTILRRGTRFEPVIADMVAEELGVEFFAAGCRYADREHPFLMAEIDREFEDAGEPVNVEIKSVNAFAARDWGPSGSDEVPIYYRAQVQHGLMVTDRQRAVLVALIGTDDLRMYDIDRDDATIEGIRDREIAFWNRHVLPDVAPEPTTAADVLSIFARDTGGAIEATDPIVECVNRLVNVRHEMKLLEEWRDKLEEQVKLFMSGNATLTVDGRPAITWKTQTARRFRQREFAAAHPQLAAQFTVDSESRVFRLK